MLGIFMERLLPGFSGQLYVYSNSRDVLDGKCSWNTDSVPCRLGGEEFAILLPNSDMAEAQAFAEHLRKSVEGQVVRYSGADLPKVTVSIGVAEYPAHGTEPQELLKAADVALYDAKSKGRNQTRVPKNAA